nr:hypothetical protein [Tanacetum cinerariifolium]
SLLEHIALYEALEASVDRENKEEFIDTTAKSRKRRRNDQDPPLPPLKDSDQSKKKTNDTNASVLQQPQAQTSSPTDDILVPDDMNLLDSEDTSADCLPKIKTRPDWLKHIPEEETLKTLEPDWVIHPNDLPKPEKNWADAISKSYKDPKEDKLLQKTRDMDSFIKWYCRQIGNSKLSKANSKGLSFKVVKAFHKYNISLQFQIEECHLLLTD